MPKVSSLYVDLLHVDVHICPFCKWWTKSVQGVVRSSQSGAISTCIVRFEVSHFHDNNLFSMTLSFAKPFDWSSPTCLFNNTLIKYAHLIKRINSGPSRVVHVILDGP